jgi:hypothetical protein
LNFLDIADSLQYIGDIINPSLLNLQDIHCNIEIDGHILAIFDEIYKLFGEDRKAIVLPASSAFFISSAVIAKFFLFFRFDVFFLF